LILSSWQDDSAVIREAITDCIRAHGAQEMRGQPGVPYYLHPMAVAAHIFTVPGLHTADTLVSAYLHDVVEDTDYTLDWIWGKYGDVVATAVDSLTRRAGEKYEAYIQRAKKDAIGRRVKMADLAINLGMCQTFPLNDGKDKSRVKRYLTAWQELAREPVVCGRVTCCIFPATVNNLVLHHRDFLASGVG
jgi:hypothetical protein